MVGISMGSDPEIFKKFRHLNPRLALLPFTTIAGTLTAAALVGCFLIAPLPTPWPLEPAWDTILCQVFSLPLIKEPNWVLLHLFPTSFVNWSRSYWLLSLWLISANLHPSQPEEQPLWIPHFPSLPGIPVNPSSSYPFFTDSSQTLAFHFWLRFCVLYNFIRGKKDMTIWLCRRLLLSKQYRSQRYGAHLPWRWCLTF